MSPFESAARAHIATRSSKATRRAYTSDLGKWLRFCEEHEEDPARPTMISVAEFKDELDLELESLSVRRVISSLSSMYDAVMSREVPLASWNPFKKLPRPPSDAYNRTEIVTDDEFQILIGSAQKFPTDPDEAILQLLYTAGLRRASVVALERSGVVRRGESTVIYIRSKGNKRGEILLSPKATEALRRWLSVPVAEASPWVFPAVRRGGHTDPGTVNKILDRHLKLTGLDVKMRTENKKKLHPHSFRAAFATTAIDAGMPLYEVQRALMHASPLTSARYDRGTRGAAVPSMVEQFREKQRDEKKDK